MTEPNKNINLSSKIQYTYNKKGTYSIILSPGEYSVKITGGKRGADGYTGSSQEANCTGQPGEQGELSSFSYKQINKTAQPDSSNQFSLSISSYDSVSFSLGRGGKGGESISDTPWSGNCSSGSNGADGSISIIPN